jgi:hypothetical protein
VIVALDASQDGGSQFLDFNKVLQTARSQYGVRITALTLDGETGRWEEINLAPVRSLPARRADGGQGSSEAQGTKPAPAPGVATRAERHFLVARIEYPDNEQTRAAGMTGAEQQVGYLVYVKPTLTGDEPPQVLGFDAVSAEFPHDSTLDQLFDAARFDAYRALGEHLGDVVATELEGQLPPAGRESTAWLADWVPGECRSREELRTFDDQTAERVFSQLGSEDPDRQLNACKLITDAADVASASLRERARREIQGALRKARDEDVREALEQAFKSLSPDTSDADLPHADEPVGAEAAIPKSAPPAGTGTTEPGSGADHGVRKRRRRRK